MKTSSLILLLGSVNVEIPIRTLLRLSDGHKPNLTEISFGFECASKQSVTAAAAAEAKFPVEYLGLSNRVGVAISKRKGDIVTSLCLAAAMVQPKHVYVAAVEPPYEPEGGFDALNAVIMRYYINDQAKPCFEDLQ